MADTVNFTISRDQEFGFQIVTKNIHYKAFNLHQIPAVMLYKKMFEISDRLTNDWRNPISVTFDIE